MGFMDVLKNFFGESSDGRDLPAHGKKNAVYQNDPRFLHNRLREIRAQNSLTQEDVAKRVGITHQAISAIERGVYSPNEKLALSISTAVGKSCDEVFYP